MLAFRLLSLSLRLLILLIILHLIKLLMRTIFGNFQKSYRHQFSPLFNTTSDFGNVQPIFSRYLADKDSISMDMSTLVRCAPMISPTFSHLYAHTKAVFVPYSSVLDMYDAIKTGQYYNGHSVTYFPHICNHSLFVALLCIQNAVGCDKFVNASGEVDDPQWEVNGASTTLYEILGHFKGFKDYTQSCFFNYLNAYSYKDYVDNTNFMPVYAQGTVVSSSSYDFWITYTDPNTQATTRYGFKLGSVGKQYVKLLRGIGYDPLNFNDATLLSALPLFSLHKALFDAYAIKRFINYTSTVGFKLTHSNISFNESKGTIFNNDVGNYHHFFNELITYSSDVASPDSVSAATINMVNTNALSASEYTGVPNNDNASVSYDDSYGLPRVNVSSGISNITVQTLSKLAKFVTQQSLVGQNISKFLKSQGLSVDSVQFADSPVLFDSSKLITVSEIYSTSDTYDGSNGSELGAYAGKGESYDKPHLEFSARGDGQLFVFFSIIPRIGWCLGTSPQLLATDRYTLKQPLYDGLGYEAQADNLLHSSMPSAKPSSIDVSQYSDLTGAHAIGYMPRLSIHKHISDLLNGDMGLGSTRNVYDSYHDELILDDSESHAAGDWRFKPWQYYDYNRYFYNVGQFRQSLDPDMDISSANMYSYDNFLVQGQLFISEVNKLKPLSESYDTYEDNASKQYTEMS